MKRDKLNKREAALLDELESLLSNPRAEEIVANDWLHDGSLSVPFPQQPIAKTGRGEFSRPAAWKPAPGFFPQRLLQ
jgi:hypothetical protein